MRVRCSYCRRYFDKKHCITIGIQRFCSEEHYYQYKGSLANSPSDKSRIPDDIRQAVIERDRGGCRFPGCRLAAGIDIHHIKYRSEGGSHEMSNLISLCREHHSLVHSDKKQYQKMCLNLIGVDYER